VCMFAWCLLAWIDHLPYVTSGSNIARYASCLQKGSRHEPWTDYSLATSWMATTKMETTHGLTYSVARTIEETTICRCCLSLLSVWTHNFCYWNQISSGYSNGSYRQRMSIKLARVLSSINAISIWLVVCAGSACVQYTLARPDSQFLCCTHLYFLCDILWPEVQSHSDSSHMHACNWSTFCTWTCLGSPYSVMHSRSISFHSTFHKLV